MAEDETIPFILTAAQKLCLQNIGLRKKIIDTEHAHNLSLLVAELNAWADDICSVLPDGERMTPKQFFQKYQCDINTGEAVFREQQQDAKPPEQSAQEPTD